MKHRYAAIMAGGAGERFWPLSRRNHPKQLLRLPGSLRTMLGDTIDRVRPLIEDERVLILTVPHLAKAILETEPGLPSANILCEPLKRNTAGCLCWLAANLLAREPDPGIVSLAILPSDHNIFPADAFIRTVQTALTLSEDGEYLVTVGIRPTRPETGYGYIEAALNEPIELGAYPVRQFHEKPSADLAAEYVASGDYLWNSGMFFWRLDAFLAELRRVAPFHFSTIGCLARAIEVGDRAEAEAVFATLPDISIDYLLMEKASRVAVVEAAFEWDDVGSWDALPRFMAADSAGNNAFGDRLLVEAEDCLVYNASASATVCLAGVRDLLVVVTDDAVLVCDRSKAQSVREVVAQLKERGSSKL